MASYKKLPVIIEAIQWNGSNVDEILGFILAKGSAYRNLSDPNSISIETLEGTMRADKNDWVIKGIKGEFYPCKPDVFEATYKLVE